MPHHITQRGNNKNTVFYSPQDYETYLNLMRTGLDSAGVRILAYALMPNHVHIIAVPRTADSLAILMRRLSGRYAVYANSARECSGRFWQGRYYSAVMSPRHLHYALRYVEMNPVRAKLVGKAVDFRWSSAWAHVKDQDPFKILDLEFSRARGSAEEWRRMLTGETETDPNLTPAMESLLRRCTYAERPFGDEEFLREAEAAIGRTWRRWPFEKSIVGGTSAFRLDHLGAPQAPSVAVAKW